MKITRLRRGYRISLSDTEFNALAYLVTLGQSDLEGVNEEEIPGTPAEKRHLFQGRFVEQAAMRVDDDRRAS